MHGKLGYSFKNVEITETDKRVVFSEWNRPSKQDPQRGVSGFKPNSDVEAFKMDGLVSARFCNSSVFIFNFRGINVC